MEKRIALISEHASPLAALGGADSGGQNVYVAQIARHLALLGFQVDVFTRRDHENLAPVTHWTPGVRIIHVPAGPPQPIRKEELLPYMEEFTRFIREFCQKDSIRYDLIHANFWMSGLVAADLKQQLQIPFVITFHALGRIRRLYQGNADRFPDLRFGIEDRIIAEADRIIAECPQDQEDLLKYYFANPAKIAVIPCGFDPAEFWPMDRPYARSKIGQYHQERIILQLGRIVPRKGVETVIRGFAHLQKLSVFPTRLLIVGGESEDPDPVLTPEIGRLQQIAQELEVSERVTFTGRRPRNLLRYYYNAADIFVTVPWYEPFGITPLEAMACARPVIGSRVGGIQYTVVDGETGYLIPAQDDQGLANCLADLLSYPERLGRFGQQGYRRARQHFTWPLITHMIVDLYQQVLNRSQISQGPLPPPLNTTTLGKAVQLIQECLVRGGRVLVYSGVPEAGDARRLAAELRRRFNGDNSMAIPALALPSDAILQTMDGKYEEIGAYQIEALGRSGDLLIGLTPGPASQNLTRACQAARHRELRTLILSGAPEDEKFTPSDVVLVASKPSQGIQQLVLQLLEALDARTPHPVQTAMADNYAPR